MESQLQEELAHLNEIQNIDCRHLREHMSYHDLDFY